MYGNAAVLGLLLFVHDRQSLVVHHDFRFTGALLFAAPVVWIDRFKKQVVSVSVSGEGDKERERERMEEHKQVENTKSTHGEGTQRNTRRSTGECRGRTEKD